MKIERQVFAKQEVRWGCAKRSFGSRRATDLEDISFVAMYPESHQIELYNSRFCFSI